MNESLIARGLVGTALTSAVIAGVVVGIQAARSQAGDAGAADAATKPETGASADATKTSDIGPDAKAPGPDATAGADAAGAGAEAGSQALDERQKALDDKAQELEKREALLKREKERIEALQEKASELAAQAETRCLKCKQAKGDAEKKSLNIDFKDPQRVAATIKKMKPRIAAAIMAKWPESLSVDTLWRLSPRVTAPILGKMEPLLAARLMARMRSNTPGGSSLLLPVVQPADVPTNGGGGR